MDTNKRPKMNKLLAEFVSICEENGIWYAMDQGSLLGVARHAGFIPWQEKVQVMMTPEAYTRFERIVADRVIDNYKYSWYSPNTPTFIEGKGGFKDDEAFIKIRIIVPTNGKAFKKYNAMRKLFTDWRNRTNYKEAIYDLEVLDHKYENYKLIGSSRLERRITSRIPAFNYDRTYLMFNSIKVAVPADYKRILETWYGKDYMEAKLPKKYYVYPNPLSKVKMKHVVEK